MKKIIALIFILACFSGYSQQNLKVDTLKLKRGGSLYRLTKPSYYYLVNNDTLFNWWERNTARNALRNPIPLKWLYRGCIDPATGAFPKVNQVLVISATDSMIYTAGRTPDGPEYFMADTIQTLYVTGMPDLGPEGLYLHINDSTRIGAEIALYEQPGVKDYGIYLKATGRTDPTNYFSQIIMSGSDGASVGSQKNPRITFQINSVTGPSYFPMYLDTAGVHINTLLLNLLKADSIQTGITNRITIDSVNSLRMSGSAVVWDDLMFPFQTGTTGGGSYPSFVADSGYYDFSAVDTTGPSKCVMYMTVQMPHDWNEGDSIYPHVHYKHETGVGTPKFWMKYKWVNLAAAITPVSWNWYKMESTTGTTDKTHQMSYKTKGLVATGKTISSLLICQIYLGPTSPTGVKAYQFDIHYSRNSLGSNTPTSKN
jgi:hypothetical protein